MPGQRSIVLVSPGFITPDLEYEYTDIIDRAVRSQIVINTLDARGLYVVIPFGDASHQPRHRRRQHGISPPPGKSLMEVAAASAQADLLAVLADSTGGIFFHNNNDFDEGFRRVAETPEYSYVLAFVPQNLKLDGSYHSLKVTLKNPQKLTLQARRGYYAPKNFADPNEQAKQEIEDAMYSQEELHNLPVNLHTQFFKASDAGCQARRPRPCGRTAFALSKSRRPKQQRFDLCLRFVQSQWKLYSGNAKSCDHEFER